MYFGRLEAMVAVNVDAWPGDSFVVGIVKFTMTSLGTYTWSYEQRA